MPHDDPLPPAGDEPNPSGGGAPDACAAGEGETIFTHRAPDDAVSTQAPTVHPAAVTARLRRTLGARGRVDLETEELPEDGISGPASRERYASLGEIARGGMGAIVKLVDRDIRRPVAMKVILGGDDTEQVARFVEEAQVTGQLEHPNIVPVHELGLTPEGKVYFTMKLVRGESLDALIDRAADADGPEAPSLPSLLEIFLKVCDAMAFAHSKGVVHRDLKPENVMVGRFGEVLVLDWGLAKVAGQEDAVQADLVATIRSERELGKTLTGDVIGTPSYMPPEQADGRVSEIDERSDVFALGGVLYRMLTFEPPYAGASVTNVLVKALQGEVTPARRRSPLNRIPAELESVCAKAMARDKADRYPSVEALAGELRAYLGHRLVSAHRYGPGARLVRFLQRHPAGALAGGVAALLVTLGLGAGLSLTAWGREQAARAETKEAEARVQAARARAETARATRMEERAVSAEELLEKGRRVSAVLRSAKVRLAPVIRDLQALHYEPPGRARRRERGEDLWAQVQSFTPDVADDPASRATWLAVQGWLRRLSGDTAEALALFARARETDGDVPYGTLFEAMTALSEYLRQSPMPGMAYGEEGLEFSPAPPDTPARRGALKRFAALVELAREARVWGAESAENFEDILSGLEGFQQGDLEAAETALTQALSLTDLSLLEAELYLARGRVRYLRKDFARALEDVEALRGLKIEFGAPVHHLEGLVRIGAGFDSRQTRALAGEAYKAAADCFARAVEADDGANDSRLQRATALGFLSDVVSDGGGDAEPLLETAVSLCDEAFQRGREDAGTRRIRGVMLLALAQKRWKKGLECRDVYERSIEDLKAVLAEDGPSPVLHWHLGMAHMNLGSVAGARGSDSRVALRAACLHLEEAIRFRPGHRPYLEFHVTCCQRLASAEAEAGRDPGPWYQKAAEGLELLETLGGGKRGSLLELEGLVRLGAGEWASRNGRDPRADFEAAMSAFDEAIGLDGAVPSYYSNRAKLHMNLARFLDRAGGDPRPEFRASIEDYGAALERDPKDAEFLSNRGAVFVMLATAELNRGGDPTPSFEAGVRDLDAALSSDPTRLLALANRGVAHESWGKHLEKRGQDPRPMFRLAVRDHEAYVRANPEAVNGWVNLGMAAQELGEAEKARGEDPVPALRQAIESLGEAQKRDPGNRDAAEYRGHAHSDLGRTLESRGLDGREYLRAAVRDFEAYERLDPGSVVPLHGKAIAFTDLAAAEQARGGDGSGPARHALAAYREVLKRDPRTWQSHANMGLLYEKAGDFENAAASYRAALDIVGDGYPILRVWLARARAAVDGPPWTRAVKRAGWSLTLRRYASAREILEAQLAEAERTGAYDDPVYHPVLSQAHHNLARICALAAAGKEHPAAKARALPEARAADLRAEALGHLQRAVALRLRLFEGILASPDFDAVRDLPAFRALAADYEKGLREGK